MCMNMSMIRTKIVARFHQVLCFHGDECRCLGQVVVDGVLIASNEFFIGGCQRL